MADGSFGIRLGTGMSGEGEICNKLAMEITQTQRTNWSLSEGGGEADVAGWLYYEIEYYR